VTHYSWDVGGGREVVFAEVGRTGGHDYTAVGSLTDALGFEVATAEGAVIADVPFEGVGCLGGAFEDDVFGGVGEAASDVGVPTPGESLLAQFALGAVAGNGSAVGEVGGAADQLLGRADGVEGPCSWGADEPEALAVRGSGGVV